MLNPQFKMNPQFQVEVTAPDTNEKEGLLVVGLMQNENRRRRKEDGSAALNFIGYYIFDVRTHYAYYFTLYIFEYCLFFI